MQNALLSQNVFVYLMLYRCGDNILSKYEACGTKVLKGETELHVNEGGRKASVTG